jgi:UPF0755 protein
VIKRLVLAVLLVLLIASGLAVRDLFLPFQGYPGRQYVEISPRTRAPAVASRLVSEGVLAHRWPFLALYVLGRYRHRLQAGEYLFDRPLRPLDVYRMLIHGRVYLHAVVIPEGSNRFDLARIFQKDLGIPANDFLRATLQPRAISDLDPHAPSLEGYLFPDTYRFPRGATAAQVIATMLNQFRRVYRNDLARRLRQSGMTLHQTVTLASLVERETPKPSERPIIAQVFELRLEIGMPLQSDPTVLYAARLDGRPLPTLTPRDLKFDSPYNTYVHAGLPPGPICSPGQASLEAALCPASTDFLYFVSDNHGGHVFARTLAQHRRNVARYRRQLAALRRSASAHHKTLDPRRPAKPRRRAQHPPRPSPSL